MFLRGYRALRLQLEEFLLDGRIAATGLLDREKVGAYLRKGEEPGDSDYVRLLEIAGAERWLRSFGG